MHDGELLQTVETMATAMGRGATATTASRAGNLMGVQMPHALKVFLQLRNP